MAHVKNHDYHILNPSWWPFLGALAGFVMLFGAVLWFHDSGPWMFLIGLVGVLYVMFGWWADVITESKVGDHTPVVQIGLRYGFILFIMSEVMFFSAWFWAFFKHTLYPMNEYIGSEYVPPDIYFVDPFHLPLMNTLVLLLFGEQTAAIVSLNAFHFNECFSDNFLLFFRDRNIANRNRCSGTGRIGEAHILDIICDLGGDIRPDDFI